MTPFIIAAGLVALLYLPFKDRDFAPGWLVVLKPLPALILGISLGVLAWQQQSAFWIYVGVGAFLLNACADWLISQKTDRGFMGGLMFAALGQICFVIALFCLRSGDYFVFAVTYLGVILLGFLYLGLVWERTPKDMRWPVVAYVFVMVTLVAVSLRVGGWALVGGGYFLLSDAALGWERFQSP